MSPDAGTCGVLGDGKPPRLRLEGRWRAWANPTRVLLAVFSRPLSRYLSLLDRPPGLCLWCADRMSSTRRTLFVLSLHRPTLHGEDERRQASTAHHAPGKNCWKWMPSPRSRSWPESISLVGPACPLRASRRSTSLCFHSNRAELGQTGQGSSRSPAWGQGRKPAARRDFDQLEHRQASCCPCGFSPDLWRSESLGYTLSEGEQGHAKSSKDLHSRV